MFYAFRYRRPDKGDGYEERRKWPIEELTVRFYILFH